MISYGQFCPVAKAAEVFGDRWTPIIMRELCFGARGFGELLAAAPLISRTVLAQRLKELARERGDWLSYAAASLEARALRVAGEG